MAPPSPAPAPFYSTPAPATLPSPHIGAPVPAPFQHSLSSSSSEEESETEDLSESHNDASEVEDVPSPVPALAPVPAPIPMPTVEQNDNDKMSDMEKTIQLDQEREEQQGGAVTSNDDDPAKNIDDNHSETLKAAADLIHTLDSEYTQANLQNATTALDADEARSAARTAAEIVRRYTTRSHPREGFDLNSFELRESPIAKYKQQTRAPMTNIQHTSTTSFRPSSAQNSSGASTATTATTNPPRYFAKTPPSAADRIAQSHKEDALALSLELERTKLALEAERIAHDETKNAVSEEKTKNFHLQQKLQRLEATMETQRESLGRTGDALEEELHQAIMRMEAAEEDAQLAINFANESEENREQLEELLQQALAENRSLRESIAYDQYPQQYAAIDVGDGNDETSHETTMKSPIDGTMEVVEEGEFQTAPEQDRMDDGPPAKRSVHFSDPISFSNSPLRHSDTQEAIMQVEPALAMMHSPNNVASPSTPLRPLVSAGRRLLHSATKHNSFDNSYTLEFTPEKSAERRQRLREQLKLLDHDVSIASPASSNSEKSPYKQVLQYTGGKSIPEIYKLTKNILEASGKRLELEGHWWRDSRASGGAQEDSPLDTLARQYCQSVEVKISRQKNEISELESLCSFLEERVTINGGVEKDTNADISMAGSNQDTWDDL